MFNYYRAGLASVGVAVLPRRDHPSFAILGQADALGPIPGLFHDPDSKFKDRITEELAKIDELIKAGKEREKTDLLARRDKLVKARDRTRDEERRKPLAAGALGWILLVLILLPMVGAALIW